MTGAPPTPPVSPASASRDGASQIPASPSSASSAQASAAAGASGRRFAPGPVAATVLGIALLAGGLYGWRSLRAGGDTGGATPPVAVTAMQVVPQDAPAALEAVGSLRAVRQVVLSPEVAGRVEAIRFRSGQSVAAGALLVQLYDGPEQADRRAAQAKARFAGVQLARSQTLAPDGAEPRERLEQRQAEREEARAAVQQIDARLRQRQVRAPFAGEIGLRRVDPGQYLNPGDTVATLTALDALYVEFALPQQELRHMRVGETVQVASDAWPGRRFVARVNAVEPRIGTDSRNVTVQATLANPDRALRPGMYVTAALQLPPQRGALLVPATALQTSAQGDSVLAVRGRNPKQGGKAQVVPVVAGRRIGDYVVIRQGLRPGDVVMTEGQVRVQPGAAVRVARLVPSASAARSHVAARGRRTGGAGNGTGNEGGR